MYPVCLLLVGLFRLKICQGLHAFVAPYLDVFFRYPLLAACVSLYLLAAIVLSGDWLRFIRDNLLSLHFFCPLLVLSLDTRRYTRYYHYQNNYANDSRADVHDVPREVGWLNELVSDHADLVSAQCYLEHFWDFYGQLFAAALVYSDKGLVAAELGLSVRTGAGDCCLRVVSKIV